MYTVTLTDLEGETHTYENIREISFTAPNRRARTTYQSNDNPPLAPRKDINLPNYISSVD